MKLYTEDQLHKLIIRYRQNLTEFSFNKPTVEQLIEELKPIQIPTNEEIESNAESFSVGFPISPKAECGEAYRLGLNDGCTNGSKWVINKLKNQQQ